MNSAAANVDRNRLLRKLQEDDGGCISVGGLYARMGVLAPSPVRISATRAALARLIELRRRERGLSLEALATTAGVELADVVTLETDIDLLPDPAALIRIADALHLPSSRLLQLSGLSDFDEKLEEAAVRFAARAKPVAQLSAQENAALIEMMEAIGSQ